MEEFKIVTPVEKNEPNYKKRTSLLFGALAVLIGFFLCVLGYMLGSGISFNDFLASQKNFFDTVKKDDQQHQDESPQQQNYEHIISEIPATSSILQTPEERIGLLPDSGYIVQYQSIYYKDRYIEDLDFDTAVYVGAGYIKDSKNLFKNGQLLIGADPERCTKEKLDQCEESLQWKSLYAPYVLDVAWNDEPLGTDETIPAGSCSNEGYVVGRINNGALAGGDVLVHNINECGMWCSASTPPTPAQHYAQFNGYLIPINEESGFSFSDSRVQFGQSSKDSSNNISDKNSIIDIPNSDYWLIDATTIGFGMGRDDEIDYLFTDPFVGSVYRSRDDCFISERPDHVLVSYRLGFDYINPSTGVLDITMLDGTKNSEVYEFIPSYHSCYDLVEQDWLKPDERLVKTGEFPNGDFVYKLANTQDEHLIETYEDKNTLASFDGGENKYSYDEYLSFNPYLYWQEPFGGWVQFMNRRFESAAEKCKPVVYLYPEETGDFSVYVEPNGGFTKTIPDYGTGWHVTATPDSQITDKKTGETYPYLYWAGINTGIPKITEGWIVENEQTEAFLIEKLAQLGLHEQEINDFNEYWVPRFKTEGADRYKIMFLPQYLFEPLAPLTVTGDETPESIIRVMMYAQPAEDGDILPEQILPPTPARKGFTVIEWGGAMLN
jgi:hypothetical protein